MIEQPDLSGRRALVMGAGGDAAQAVALALAGAGADVALATTTPDAEEAFGLRRLARKVEALGRRSLVESVDMSIGTSVQVCVRQVAKALGGIDILLAAPQFSLDKPAERLTDAEWARIVGLNLSATFYACRSVAREMRSRPPEAGKGRIIVLLPEGEGGGAAYLATRSGARSLVPALAREWASLPLAINGIAVPADVSPDEVAAVTLWLASPEAESMSGEVLAGNATVEGLRSPR